MDFEEEKERNKPRLSDKERHEINYLIKRDPMKEFFNLTCQSVKLNSPNINSICHVETNNLYKKA